MAANYWDNSDADNDGNNPNNWSLGTVPAGTDVATFDNTSDDNCTFTDNSAAILGKGGGMYNSGSDPTLTNCTFTSNTADEYGGGMYNLDSSPT